MSSDRNQIKSKLFFFLACIASYFHPEIMKKQSKKENNWAAHEREGKGKGITALEKIERGQIMFCQLTHVQNATLSNTLRSRTVTAQTKPKQFFYSRHYE